MISVFLFEFDKIFKQLPYPTAKDIKDLCFRPYPVIQWEPHAYEAWREARKQKLPIVLVSQEKETYIKEAIYGAGLCPCFDHFIFVDELSASDECLYDVVMRELGRVYGSCKPYRYHPVAPLSPTSFKLHFRYSSAVF